LAAGGRYDALVAAFHNAVQKSRSLSGNSQNRQNPNMENCIPNQSVAAVGGVIYMEKLVTAMEKRKESRYNLSLPPRLITAFIVCVIDCDSSFEE